MRAFLLIIILFCLGCTEKENLGSISPNNWKSRESLPKGSQQYGTTYLPIYSRIYSVNEERNSNLTVTVSLRNLNLNDSVYIHKAEYFDTGGGHIRTYFNYPIYLAPLETVEIVIDELDETGGSGANFIFKWSIKEGCNSPLFEAVMISTLGQQGLSFTTRGIEIN